MRLLRCKVGWRFEVIQHGTVAYLRYSQQIYVSISNAAFMVISVSHSPVWQMNSIYYLCDLHLTRNLRSVSDR